MDDEEDLDDEDTKKVIVELTKTAAEEKTSLKFILNSIKVKVAVDSGASANVIDEERFKKDLSKSSSWKNPRLYVYGSQVPIPVAGKFEAVIEAYYFPKLMSAEDIVSALGRS